MVASLDVDAICGGFCRRMRRNDLGLLSEEYDAPTGRLIGNFPQAFSHLALIHSATVLSKMEGLTP